MGTIVNKLNKLLETKAAIKAALVEKGQTPGDVFSEYPNMIKSIKTDNIKLSALNVISQPYKISYNAKETFDPAGMQVIAMYSNGASKTITDFTVEPSRALSPLDTKVNVKYTEFGVTVQTEVNITVSHIRLDVPREVGGYIYTGSTINSAWSGYDASLMSMDGVTAAIDAGTYGVKFALRDTLNYRWSDGTTADKTVTWTIGKAQASISLSKTSVTLNGDNPTETIAITSVGMNSIVAASSDTSVATISMSGNTLTVSNVNETTGNATINFTGEVNNNYNAPTYPSIVVHAEFAPPTAKITFNRYINGTPNTLVYQGYSAYCRIKIDGVSCIPSEFPQTIEVPVGTVLSCVVIVMCSGKNAYISVNGTKVLEKYNKDYPNSTISPTYNYTVTGDTTILCGYDYNTEQPTYNSGNIDLYYGYIEITENSGGGLNS